MQKLFSIDRTIKHKTVREKRFPYKGLIETLYRPYRNFIQTLQNLSGMDPYTFRYAASVIFNHQKNNLLDFLVLFWKSDSKYCIARIIFR